ncbi:MAG: helix-turn-helix domain-containing protein [Eubacteriaceae bacterium]|nr:helix-turn-helix domain-containing protein [Eubacteriaceae bacterium]
MESIEEKYYDLKELSMMSGLTDRTLRTYISMGMLSGEKVSGSWRFSASELERFFSEPYMKEGMKIKRNSIVFDFLSDTADRGERTCAILDIPSDRAESAQISAFFCERMQEVTDTVFRCDWDAGHTRIVVS